MKSGLLLINNNSGLTIIHGLYLMKLFGDFIFFLFIIINKIRISYFS